MDTHELLLLTMLKAGKALKPGELVEMSGLSRPEVDKALKLLKKEEKITSPKACFWEPKK